MSTVIAESIEGLMRGIIYGAAAFLIVMLLSIVYKYFTNERLSSFIGILFGLGFLGFSGGLLAVFEEPNVKNAVQIVTISILIVWGVNTGDKIAEKIPKKSAASILDGIRGAKPSYITVKLPDARLIFDIVGKPKVADTLKAELSDREFTIPADLPLEEIVNRVKRRLITDWGVGDAEIELDQDGRVIHLAISAKERGLSAALPEGSVAIPIECRVIPSNLAPGDFVKIFLENYEIIERIEIKGVDEEHRVITIVADEDLLEKVQGNKSSLVVALPYTLPAHQTISVKQPSGEIEEFNFQRIVNSLKKVGIEDELANKIVAKIQDRLYKMDSPIPARFIKTAIIKQLEKENPEAAKKLRVRRLWELKAF
jgi:hypothetical protein